MTRVQGAGRLWESLVVHRFAWLAAVDVLLWSAVLPLGIYLRYELSVPTHAWESALPMLPVLAFVQVIAGCITGIYLGRYQLGSFEEVSGMARAFAATALTLVVADVLWNVVPMSQLVFVPVTTFALSAALRYAWRVTHDSRRRPGDDAVRTVVVGAGSAGSQAVRALLASPDSPYVPVALIDDDPRKRNLNIRGVPVRGGVDAIGRVATDTGATALLIAIPSADAVLVRAIAKRGADNDLKVRILPPVAELIGGTVGVSDIRPITP